MIGIFAQTRDEVQTILDNVTINSSKTVGNITIYNVTNNGNTFYVIITGVGKVNAALGLTYALVKLCIKKVIVVGNTASLDETDAAIGSVAIATSSLEWDVDYEALGYDANVVPNNNVSNYPTDPNLLKEAVTTSNGLGYTTVSGVYATGDTFVATTTEASEINTETGALFLDNNSGAIGQVSYQMNIPYIVIKGVSNYANDTAVTDYNTNKENANNLSNRVALSLLNTLFEETPSICCNNNTTNNVIAYPCAYSSYVNQGLCFNNINRNNFYL